MNLTPPIHQGEKPRWRRATRLKSLVAAGAIAIGFAGVGLAVSGPAHADPAVNYVAVGSDTIQDVMNGFALLEGNVLGSYNAVNPVTAVAHEVITPSKVPFGSTAPLTSCSFTRPNGSTEGAAALDYSLTQNATNLNALAPPLVSNPPGSGCVDVGRSSSAPKTNCATVLCQSATGGLVYVPFALDAVAGAIGPTSVLTNAGMFTSSGTPASNPGDLQNLYGNCIAVTEGGVTYWPQGSNQTRPAGSVVIDLYMPQNGSGTEKFWAGKVGVTLASDGSFNSTQFPCVHQTILAGPSTGSAVEEHDGTAYNSDPNGYGPFSIAQFIAQTNGFGVNRLHGVVLENINGVSPFNASGQLNTAYPYTREVYNVAATDRVVNGIDSNFDSVLSGLLNGSTSALCKATITIKQYGFATLSASTPDLCGSTATTLRAVE